MSEREELLEKAQELGIEFQKNTPSVVLEQRIAEAENGSEANVKDEPEVETLAKPEPAPKSAPKPVKVLSPEQERRKYIAARKKAAFKTKVVTITSRDPRENSKATAAYLGFENQYFGRTRVVPLDVPIELEVALIDIAKKSTMTLHKEQIVAGKRTGNSKAVRTRKYTVSYAEDQPTS